MRGTYSQSGAAGGVGRCPRLGYVAPLGLNTKVGADILGRYK